eukprot:GHUV01006840.1.p1 GENE.GHUV01006840.1~~GHUV01006840.1.p1  ORF type:complete len:358 (+),score=138.67 GHUV01006840.1:1-1074(+)
MVRCEAADNDPGQDATASPHNTSSSSSSSTQPPGIDSSSKVLQKDGSQLAQLLQKLSDLDLKPHEQWLLDVLDILQPQLQQLEPAELSGCLQVFGSWSFTPPEHFMQAYHAATRQQIQQQKLGLRHLADIAWGLAQLQNPRQPLLDEVLAAAGAAMATSRHTHSSSGGSSSGGESSAKLPDALADLIWAIAKLQLMPDHAWLSSFEATSQAVLETFTPHQLAQVVWGFARLPWQPGQSWMDAYLEAVQLHLKDFDSKSVSLTAWGLATLKVQPGVRWLYNFEVQAKRTLSTLAASELACTLWALSQLKNKQPHELSIGRAVRKQDRFWDYDYSLLSNPRLLRVVRSLTLGPQTGNRA